MVLTKNDLGQIRDVIQEEVSEIVDDKLDIKLKPIKKELKYLRKTSNLIIENYEEEDTSLKKRVKKLENHLGLSTQN